MEGWGMNLCCRVGRRFEYRTEKIPVSNDWCQQDEDGKGKGM